MNIKEKLTKLKELVVHFEDVIDTHADEARLEYLKTHTSLIGWQQEGYFPVGQERIELTRKILNKKKSRF